MTARAIIALAVLFASVTAAAGETLPVRAGEHGDYSRLVIPNAPADWRIATSDRKIEITFADKDVVFDLADILDRRKAHRVLSARVLDTDETRALVLSLTCDCPVRTSKGSGGSIVIDIFNATPITLTEEESGPPPSPISNEARTSGPSTPENLRAARDRMIALLAEARQQGVVQLKADDAREAEDAAASAAGKGATAVTEASYRSDTDDGAANDFSLSTNTPPLAEHSAPAQLVSIDEASCVDPVLFNEPDDEHRAVDYSAISSLRQRLDISENDDERRDIASTLAVAYIHIGFFEEANAVAAPLAREGDGNMAVAAALADFASGAKGRAAHDLAPYRQCSAFFELAHAAAAGPYGEGLAAMMDKHVRALSEITTSLRAPLAEALGLAALENGDTEIARAFYDVAVKARTGENSAALAIMEKSLAIEPGEIASADKHLTEVARTPGPLQARALALLAEDYKERADASYEGFLDDIAAQTTRRGSSLAEAKASFTGAKALAGAGRLGEGVAVLSAAGKSAPGAREASQALARSLIITALLADDETRLEAISTFFQHRDFVAGGDNGDVNVAVARELAAFGANHLVDDALEGAPALWRAQSDAVKALSHLNGDDAEGAAAIAASGQPSDELALVAVRARERMNDRNGARAAIRSALANGAQDDAFAAAAWRTQDWGLALEAFEQAPAKERGKPAAARVSLSALNAGAKSLPEAVREALAADPESLSALAHMFAAAPAVNLRAIDLLAGFSQGVAKETFFMETGLKALGDGDE
jgi:hypothetical protein